MNKLSGMRFGKIIVLLIISQWITAQESPIKKHDILPGVILSYKPAPEPGMPEWATMMYQDNINFYELENAFIRYKKDFPDQKSPWIRYYLHWSKAARSYVDQEGHIFYEENNEERNPNSVLYSSTEDSSDWTFLGPKETFWLNESGSAQAPKSCPWQVNIYAFDVAKSNPNKLYAGTETGFVNKTIDQGLTWQLMAADYYFGGGITAVAIDPINDEKVYVSGGNQLHLTEDGGKTWRPLLNNNKFAADRLKIREDLPALMYAAAPTGLFVSTDGGTNWIKKWNSPVYDVIIKPDMPAIVLALTKKNGKFSLLISQDSGTTFEETTSFPGQYTESSGGILAVTPADPGLLLCIMLCQDNTPVLLKGKFNSNEYSWNVMATGRTNQLNMDNGQGYFDLDLAVSPTNPNIIYVGTTTLYKSENGGLQFSPVGGYAGNFPIHPDIQAIKVLGGGDVWISTDGGMNYSKDNFLQATQYSARINGLTGSDFWGFDQGWNEDIIVGGRYHNGNTAISEWYQPKSLRMGGAESPTGWVIHGKSRHVAFDDLGSGWILPEKAEGKHAGRFAFTKFPNMDEYGGRRGNLLHHPNYHQVLFTGEGNGFWKTEDMGKNWTLLHQFPGRVRFIQISHSHPDILYADIVNNGLYRSGDGGITWEQRPSLTSGTLGNSSWRGNLFVAVSPYDGNVVYACLQNGTWSANIGKIFRSRDGGLTWEDWTSGLSEYLKCIVIQPTKEGKDLVYLFTTARAGKSAKVFYRKAGTDSWTVFDKSFPRGANVNLALPFYRDSKIRFAGGAGVWESPLQETSFTPLLQPWIDKPLIPCYLDTLQLDDHSIINHADVSWEWSVSPTPAYISNTTARNPKLVLGSPGTYDVTMTVHTPSGKFVKHMPKMVEATTCPSVQDCSNPDNLPKNEWSLIYASSEEKNYPGAAVMTFDNDENTIWHTRWSTGSDPYPHEIQIALGTTYKLFEFTYQTRLQGENGRIKSYELYVSDDSLSWGEPVVTGEFINTSAPQTIKLPEGSSGKYFMLLALSEVNGNAWASAAEFYFKGCIEGINKSANPHLYDSKAFPVPATHEVRIDINTDDISHIDIYSQLGQIMPNSNTVVEPGNLILFVDHLPAGVYFGIIQMHSGQTYRIKFIKN